MDQTIDLRDYISNIRKRFSIIAIITIVAMLVSGGVSFFLLSPVYETNTTMIVNKDKTSEDKEITGDDMNVNQKLAFTYGEIIKSRKVLGEVISDLNLDLTTDDLAKKISVGSVKDTQIININVQDTDPKLATNIANTIPNVFNKEVKRIMKADSVEVIDKAIVPENPIKPNKFMNVAVSTLLGLMIGIFTVSVLEYMDKKIKTPQDIEKHLGFPVLGVILNEDIEK